MDGSRGASRRGGMRAAPGVLARQWARSELGTQKSGSLLQGRERGIVDIDCHASRLCLVQPGPSSRCPCPSLLCFHQRGKSEFSLDVLGLRCLLGVRVQLCRWPGLHVCSSGRSQVRKYTGGLTSILVVFKALAPGTHPGNDSREEEGPALTPHH